MNIRTLAFATAVAVLAGSASSDTSAQTLGSGITYQGMFADNGVPASGTYDFEFALYTVATSGTAVQTVTKSDVVVNGGLINTLVDFGAATYDGQVKWIEVHVRPGASTGAYTTLAPRQALTAAPYAMGLPMPFQRDVSTGNATAFKITSVQSGTAIEGIVPDFSGNPAIHGTALGATGVGVRGDSPGDGVVGNSALGSGVHGTGDTGGNFQGVKYGIKVSNSSSCHSSGGACGAATMTLENPLGGELVTAHSNGSWVFRIEGDGKVFANGGFQASGADLAEHVPSASRLEAGDVVEIDAENGALFQLSSHPNSTAVAGVISTKPGVTLNGSMSEDEAARGLSRLALSGRVPVKVTSENGAIRAGDLLVSSSRPGRAMRAPANPQPGTVIGKAMQKLDHDSGEIEMLVMLR
jgi:hypothetical protein